MQHRMKRFDRSKALLQGVGLHDAQTGIGQIFNYEFGDKLSFLRAYDPFWMDFPDNLKVFAAVINAFVDDGPPIEPPGMELLKSRCRSERLDRNKPDPDLSRRSKNGEPMNSCEPTYRISAQRLS